VRPREDFGYHEVLTAEGERVYGLPQSSDWQKRASAFTRARPDHREEMEVVGVHLFVDATGSPHEMGSACPIVATFELYTESKRNAVEVKFVLGYLPKFGKRRHCRPCLRPPLTTLTPPSPSPQVRNSPARRSASVRTTSTRS